MRYFILTSTGLDNQCILTGPMGKIVSVEFLDRRSAALFAQIQADGYPAILRLVNERGGYEGDRDIPPPAGVEPKREPENTVQSPYSHSMTSPPVEKDEPFSMLTLQRYKERQGGNGRSPRGPRMRS
jgi:hypothetical protein